MTNEKIEDILSKCECRQNAVHYFIRRQYIECDKDVCYYQNSDKYCQMLKHINPEDFYIRNK